MSRREGVRFRADSFYVSGVTASCCRLQKRSENCPRHFWGAIREMHGGDATGTIPMPRAPRDRATTNYWDQIAIVGQTVTWRAGAIAIPHVPALDFHSDWIYSRYERVNRMMTEEKNCDRSD